MKKCSIFHKSWRSCNNIIGRVPSFMALGSYYMLFYHLHIFSSFNVDSLPFPYTVSRHVPLLRSPGERWTRLTGCFLPAESDSLWRRRVWLVVANKAVVQGNIHQRLDSSLQVHGRLSQVEGTWNFPIVDLGNCPINFVRVLHNKWLLREYSDI